MNFHSTESGEKIGKLYFFSAQNLFPLRFYLAFFTNLIAAIKRFFLNFPAFKPRLAPITFCYQN